MRNKLLFLSLGLLAILGIYFLSGTLRSSFYYGTGDDVTDTFPVYSDADLTQEQRDILAIAKREWQAPKAAQVYSAGASEPWCADFLSYIYDQAGHPFENPVSGGWRIPGIYTLKDYLVSNHRWHAVGEDYTPQPADIAIYDRGVFGGHANLVLATLGHEIITLGGNENSQVMLRRIDYTDDKYGLLGFGSYR